MNFVWEIYKELNPDLIRVGLRTKQQYERHYMMYGKREGRKCNILQLYPDFSHHSYRDNYEDLKDMNNEELELHWLQHGIKECRNYNILNNSNSLINSKSLKILFNNNCGYYLVKTLVEYFALLNINAIIVDKIIDNDMTIYLIPFGHLYNIPISTKYILYQLEQKKQSNWITDSFYNKVDNSIITFDYSYANIHEFNNSKIVYVPLPLSFNKEVCNNYDIDILFFGAINNRRKCILDTLKKVYNNRLVCINGKTGEELNNYIKRSKIILNIHFYDNALLETTRLNEVLKYNKKIVSELGNIQDEYNNKLYEGIVEFVDIINDDNSNINLLIDKINYNLSNNRYRNIDNEKVNSLTHYCYNTFSTVMSKIQL